MIAIACVLCVAEADAHEGPVYVAGEDALYSTSVPRCREPHLARRRTVVTADTAVFAATVPRVPEEA